MVLIIGGVGQGKLDYARKKFGFSEKDVFLAPEDWENRLVFNHLEHWVQESLASGKDPAAELESLLGQGFDGIILCDEVGCGVVPAEKGQRLWREAVGRLCCTLAERSHTVVRVFCGLPTVLKGV